MKGVLGGLIGIGFIGEFAGSGLLLSLIGIGILAFGIEWLVADPTRMLISMIVALVLAWLPIVVVVFLVVRTLVARTGGVADRLVEVGGILVFGFFAMLAFNIMPLWLTGYGCEAYELQEHDERWACVVRDHTPILGAATFLFGVDLTSCNSANRSCLPYYRGSNFLD